ncbi:hypothetical protein VPH35_109573 [Triticum aestivum]
MPLGVAGGAPHMAGEGGSTRGGGSAPATARARRLPPHWPGRLHPRPQRQAAARRGPHLMDAGTSSTDKNSRFHNGPWSQILLKLIKFDIQKGTAFLSGSGCWFLATMVAGKRA